MAQSTAQAHICDGGQNTSINDLGGLAAVDDAPSYEGIFERSIVFLCHSMGVICAVAVLAMALIISYEVVARYIFNSPTTWVTEYSLYLLVASSFLAAGYAQIKDSHIRVDAILNLLSSSSRRKLLQISAWIGLIMVIIAGWQMVIFVCAEYANNSRAFGLLTTPLWIPESAVSAGIVLFALALLVENIKLNSINSGMRKYIGLLLFLGLIVALLLLGDKSLQIAGSHLDWGLIAILLAVLIIALFWSGYKIAIVVAVIIVGGGFLFNLTRDFSNLVQGAVAAIFLLLLMAIGLRIAIALWVTGAMAVLMLLPTPQLQVIAERSWTSVNSFGYTAIPMFILMGAFLARSGVTGDMFGALRMWIGRFPGGIGHATVGACGVFAAVSGSSLATAATMGMTACPEMINRGYSPRLAYGVVAAGGTLGILIPPSIAMIFYGSIVGQPVDALFMAGVIPGLMLMLSFMAVVFGWSLIFPNAAPRSKQYSWNEKFHSLIGVFPFIILILGVLGSLYLGVATPTEAGAIGAVTAGVICLFKKKMTFKILLDSVLETINVTSYLIIIVAAAMVMAYAFDYIRLPLTLVEMVRGADLAPWQVMSILVIFYVILGMFIDPVSMVLMTLTVTYSIVTAIGLDPIWFGVVLVMMIEIGLITPPVGMILFILRGMSGNTPFKDIVYGVLPFVVTFFFNLLLLYAFPNLALWLPNNMGSGN